MSPLLPLYFTRIALRVKRLRKAAFIYERWVARRMKRAEGNGRNVMSGLAFPNRFSRESALADGEDV
jgi:hypothetical protein